MQAGLVIAEVFSVNAHPKSDRLRVCSVDYGHDVAQVVTNATEVAVGMKVIFAVCLLLCTCICGTQHISLSPYLSLLPIFGLCALMHACCLSAYDVQAVL